MVSIESFDKRQFVRCPKCHGVVARTDIGVDGVCRSCKTRRKSNWDESEQRRMERAEREAKKEYAVCPVCDTEHILMEDKKRCRCGYVIRKKSTQ